jgi:hypothetical protein
LLPDKHVHYSGSAELGVHYYYSLRLGANLTEYASVTAKRMFAHAI